MDYEFNREYGLFVGEERSHLGAEEAEGVGNR